MCWNVVKVTSSVIFVREKVEEKRVFLAQIGSERVKIGSEMVKIRPKMVKIDQIRRMCQNVPECGGMCTYVHICGGMSNLVLAQKSSQCGKSCFV